MINKDIFPSDPSSLVSKLIKFLGEVSVDTTLKKFKQRLSSSSLIYRRYVEDKHPFLYPLLQYKKIISSGKSFNSIVNNCIARGDCKWLNLINSAKKISEIYKHLPDDTRSIYKSNLLDFDNASSYLYEITIATHYLINNYNVRWISSPHPSPEFIVDSGEFHFSIECKHTEVGTFYKLSKGDFYRFCDALIAKLSSQNCMGSICIRFKERLPSDITNQNIIVTEITNMINSRMKGYNTFQYGEVVLNTKEKDNKLVAEEKLRKEVSHTTPDDGFGIVHAEESGLYKKNPIIITANSTLDSRYVVKLFDLIKKSASRQLYKDIPGILSVHIPEIQSFDFIHDNDDFILFASKKLEGEKYKHLGAVVLSSDGQYRQRGTSYQSYYPTYILKNPNCDFPLPSEFPFLPDKVS